ncbi:alpha/beta-hydrolase [Neoconidiobolus thromboides FSU 785]|nr:alpha/beta-hydrolase [Neoconidiobolus thromboides FSU 785]
MTLIKNPFAFQQILQDDIKKLADGFKDLLPQSILLPTNTNLKKVTEEEAKNIAYYAGTSFCDEKKLQTWSCTHCESLPDSKLFKIYFDKDTEGRGVLVTNQKKKLIVLAFRGSSTVNNWLQDARFRLVPLYGNDRKIKVHSGFKLTADNLFGLYKDDLKLILSTYPDYQLITTGHSLGGAVSTLSMVRIKDEFNIPDSQLINVSYGSPRIGNYNFALKISSMGHSSLRVTSKSDAIPHLPPRMLGYVHHLTELWVNDPKGKNKVCDSKIFEDVSCSLSIEPRVKPLDHLTYWDIPICGEC